MKTDLPKSTAATLFCAIAFTVFLLTGCVSSTVPTDPTPRQQVVANAVEDTLAIGLVPVLTKNPAYIAEAKTAAGLILAFQGATITTDGVDSLLVKLKVAPEDARIISGLVVAAWDTYQRRYAEQVGKTLRPDVKLFLTAVANGIDRAVAATPK